MAINPPKVSFIPKAPLAYKQSFMASRRPRSVSGILAIIAFVASIGAYAGLYFYESSLSTNIEAKNTEIKAAQSKLSRAPEIGEAKVFRARAELANELLSSHVVVSPIFEFLEQNTLTSVFYKDFNFKHSTDGWTLVLAGEAPGYSSVAYQMEVLRRNNTNKFIDFLIGDVMLTNTGTVTFNLTMTFSQNQLSYLNLYKKVPSVSTSAPSGVATTSPSVATSTPLVLPVTPAPQKGAAVAPSTEVPSVPSTLFFTPSLSEPAAPGTTTLGTPSASTTTPQGATSTPSSVGGWTVATTTEAQAPVAVTEPSPQSTSWWSWFKFW